MMVARLHVRVQPGARRTGWHGWFGDLPRLAVAAPPVEGAANEAVLKAVAALAGVRVRDVRLVGGAAARTKRLEITGISDDALAAALAAALGPRPSS